ncbi:uncharacterized protein LOC119078054 [Bradysia coprophila]|uniref:uncharacterized protein LOC119078054 n=1 Tax=Bradysia coprophila TaxID=38358 RepID=UPI00187DA965|nr:uncharacterized protein LOC119078054 [Bradysia coprophila]
MSSLFLSRSFNRGGKKSNVSANNNTIYEKESPVEGKNRLNNTVCGAPIKSPCTKFQRHNSNPFPATVSCATPVQETPKKLDDSRQQKSLGKLLKYIRPNSRKKKNQSKQDRSFKVYDELIISPQASPQVGQVYEKSFNLHGDEVEYAVPYSDVLAPIIINDSASTGRRSVTTENLLDESWNDRSFDISAMDFISPAKITDLDKSSHGYRSLHHIGKEIEDNSNRDVLSELDSLEKWSQNIPHRSLPAHEPPIDTIVHIIKCKPREIKPKRSILRNTISLPLHFSSGFFRKTPVALRTCCPRDSASVGLVEEAIERDYDILNKVKHSNIILLMAASFQKKSLEHMTLVLEPVDYTLNYFIHQMDTTLSLVESISTVQQIASAALYLQECGYIHSNISSHNILVRENPWCVKLSSFELTTEVDFVDTKAELMIKYRHKLSSFNNQCTDTPKYATIGNATASLKDRYRQMSKLLPILKCSPNTQHKYLSMISRHLIYDTNYRQHLSLHNFQAPELLTTKLQFVFPTTKTDVYSLCLLLWEMLNSCVPFVVYSKLDMERMIENKKLNLPFFEQERCQPFKDVLKIGLSINPENRTIDVQQLITMLEDIKFRVRTGAKDQVKEQHTQRSYFDHEMNTFVNTNAEAHPIYKSLSVSSIQSPTLTDFNLRLLENEVTSTKKRQRKSPQKFIKKKAFRQLFKTSKETVNDSECVLPNDHLETMATELRNEQSLDEIQEEAENNFNLIGAPLSSEENEFQSNDFLKRQADRDGSSERDSEWRKTSPERVDVGVTGENQSANSKSCGNLFDASTSKPPGRSFHSNIVSPPGYGFFNVGEYSLPDTPIARKNKIRRNAWLSNKSLNVSNKEIDDLAKENNDKSFNDSNQLNISIRIVHTKVTPKKLDSGNPLVMSRIKFFDSNTEQSLPATSFNKTNNSDGVEDFDLNYSAHSPIKYSSSKELVELTTAENSLPGSSVNRSTDENGSVIPMPRKDCADSRNQSANTDQLNDSFENKLWKREMNICNRSQGSSDTDTNIIAPKWQSVRDKILKFEERGISTTKQSLPSLTAAAEFVRNLSNSVTNIQSNDRRLTEVPTVIKRTIFSESTFKVSGVDAASIDNPMPLFDQLNGSGQKLTTQVTLNMRQIRRRSLDMDDVDRPKIEGTTGMRHTICGSQKGLLSFNAGESKDGSSADKTKYICSDCTTKMTPEELRALTSVAETSLNSTNITQHSSQSPATSSRKTPQRRCQVRVKSQDTRSIEDLYIDDDFDQGLGANIELHSDSSDFLNFDIISDIFNKSKEDT